MYGIIIRRGRKAVNNHFRRPRLNSTRHTRSVGRGRKLIRFLIAVWKASRKLADWLKHPGKIGVLREGHIFMAGRQIPWRTVSVENVDARITWIRFRREDSATALAVSWCLKRGACSALAVCDVGPCTHQSTCLNVGTKVAEERLS